MARNLLSLASGGGCPLLSGRRGVGRDRAPEPVHQREVEEPQRIIDRQRRLRERVNRLRAWVVNTYIEIVYVRIYVYTR